MPTHPPNPSSVLAFVTTIHLTLAALRNYRRPSTAPLSALMFVSLCFSAAPWLFPSALGLSLGLVSHGIWYAACELLTRSFQTPAMAAAAPSASSDRRSTPVPVSRPAAAGGAPTPPASPVAARSSAEPIAAAQKGFFGVSVLATVQETSDIATIRLERPHDFEFKPGQFVAVRIRVDGKDHVRCYSISSAPGSIGYFEISVKRQGCVSNALHATARPGGRLSVRSPGGAFVYPSGDDRPIVLLGGGVGVTPLMSMLRHAVNVEPTRPIALLYSVRTEKDIAFRDELASLSRRHPQLRLRIAATGGPVRAPFHQGRIDEKLLRAAVPNLTDSICFMCGPEPMLNGMKELLRTLGVPAPQIRFELFQAATAVAAGLPEERTALSPRLETAPAPGVASASPSGGFEMHCVQSGKNVPVQMGQTLLDAAEAQGIDMPALCRSGVCGTCRVRVTKGSVDCRSTMLDEDDVKQGFVLACVATPQTHCAVEA
jgi:ferredoxin-NADP reductase